MSEEINSGAVLKAIAAMTQASIEDAGFDKTLVCTIVNCEDSEAGVYLVKYQDSEFTAISSNASDIYAKDDKVYVLIPAGDKKRKSIVGYAAQREASRPVREIDIYEAISTKTKLKSEEDRIRIKAL